MTVTGEYVDAPRVTYVTGDEAVASFVRVCEKCGRFVKADDVVRVGFDGLDPGPNATCSKCGRTRMLFEGFFGEEDQNDYPKENCSPLPVVR